MEQIWVLAVIAVIWMIGGPFLALSRASRADRRADELAERLARLEQLLPEGVAGAEPATVTAAAALGSPAASPWLRAEVAASEPSMPPTPAAEPAPDLAGSATPESPAEDVPAATAPERPGESLESKIGARWTVLVGGVALALGAVFLVRYSIEQGLLGPATRIALGFLLSVGLFAGGEILRRRDRSANKPVFATADIPAILTGAGAVAIFATIYAAYALYGFVGSATAFLLLTAAGLATLFLSVIHGPALAALGALGSYAAPLLVGSSEPQALPVTLHTLVVTAAVLAMARIRGWRWLATAGVLGSLGWGILISLIASPNIGAVELLMVAGLAAIYVGGLVAGGASDLHDRDPDRQALAALAAIAGLSVFYGGVEASYPVLVSGILLCAALGAVGSRWPESSGAAIIAGALAVITMMLLRPAGPQVDLGTMQVGTLSWRVLGPEGLGWFTLRAAAIGAVAGLGGFFSADRFARTAPQSAGFFAACGAGAPLFILLVVYLRHVPFETRPTIGLVALVLAAAFAGGAERLIARRPSDDYAPAPSLFAAGAVLALSFALSVALSPRFIPLALSLGALGIVWVMRYRSTAVLPWLAVGCAALACAALVFGPPLGPAEIGTRPFLNGLILRFGLPALALLWAGESLRRHRDGVAAGLLQAIGLAIAALFVVLQIRHAANNGVLATAGVPGLGEQSALTLAALLFSFGVERMARRTGSTVYRGASLLFGTIGAAQIAVAHFVTANPLLTGEPIGTGLFLNLLLPGYLLPALAAAAVAAGSPAVRPPWYRRTFAALALALAFAYVTFMVRRAFHGPNLAAFGILDAENWSYSAVWLLLGVALLAAGIGLRSAPIRAASGVVIAAVVCKVFLLDMSNLTGVLRAASFLGLGAGLILIGRVYQRLLAKPPSALPPSTGGSAPAV